MDSWANGFRIMTTSIQRPLCLGPTFQVYSNEFPMDHDHLQTAAAILRSRELLLNTNLKASNISTNFTNMQAIFEVFIVMLKFSDLDFCKF